MILEIPNEYIYNDILLPAFSMYFNISFALATALSFTAHFPVNTGTESQNYFIFTGVNNTAHLYRNNDTLSLHIQDRSNYQLLQMEGVSNLRSFEFKWDEFRINGRSMDIKTVEGNCTRLDFDAFNFISPIDIWNRQVMPGMQAERIYHYDKEIKYGWFAFIAFGVGLLLKFDLVCPKILQKFLQLIRSEELAVEAELEGI